jgi:hypothetical protein
VQELENAFSNLPELVQLITIIHYRRITKSVPRRGRGLPWSYICHGRRPPRHHRDNAAINAWRWPSTPRRGAPDWPPPPWVRRGPALAQICHGKRAAGGTVRRAPPQGCQRGRRGGGRRGCAQGGWGADGDGRRGWRRATSTLAWAETDEFPRVAGELRVARPSVPTRHRARRMVARDVLRPARGLVADAQVRAPAMHRGRRASGLRGSAAQRSGAADAREARTVQLVTQAVPAVEETHAPHGDSAAGSWEGTPPPVIGENSTLPPPGGATVQCTLVRFRPRRLEREERSWGRRLE